MNMKIFCFDRTSAEVVEYFQTEVDLVGDLYHILTRLAEELRDAPHETPDSRLNDIVLGRFMSAKDDDAFPMQPPRALWDIRNAMGRDSVSQFLENLVNVWLICYHPFN